MAGDILELLEEDHQVAKALLARFEETVPADRDGYFCEVVHTLIAHEVAEELVVYPEVRGDQPDGERIAEERISEQSEAEETLADLEKMDIQSGEFATRFMVLRESVLAHAQAEEATVFPMLERTTGGNERQELGARYLKAKANAPTHPHPHSPDTPPGNMVLGPVAALFDRARDAVQHR